MRWMVVMLLLGSLLSLAPTGSAQIKSCGELDLFIANPDMRDVSTDGKYHVGGDLFMQFQVIGPGASEIETFAFSVGLPVENPEEICALPVWPGGLMLEAYKADTDKTDGFFIFMNTGSATTPQNIDLSVAVHGYDAAGNELARFWTTAVVESCPGPVGQECTPEQKTANDHIMPWPIVLPGDGEKALVNGFTLEFAEPLASLEVRLNNEDITDELVEWDGRLWDKDTFYDYGPAGAIGSIAGPCTLTATPLQNCDYTYGPAYEWTVRGMTADDVIRVVAVDMAGNEAIKEIHIGSSVAGGTIDDGIPILQMTTKEPTLTGMPGETIAFTMTLENTGSGEGHPFSEWIEGRDYPEGWAEPVWSPGHKPVPPQSRSEQQVLVTIPDLADEGSYDILARMNYKQAGQDKSVNTPLTIDVIWPAEGLVIEPETEEKESPGVGIVSLVGLLGLASVSMRRRKL